MPEISGFDTASAITTGSVSVDSAGSLVCTLAIEMATLQAPVEIANRFVVTVALKIDVVTDALEATVIKVVVIIIYKANHRTMLMKYNLTG